VRPGVGGKMKRDNLLMDAALAYTARRWALAALTRMLSRTEQDDGQR